MAVALELGCTLTESLALETCDPDTTDRVTLAFDVVTLTTGFQVDAVFGVLSTYAFAYVNSLVNPIIYCMNTEDFKRALK